MQAEYGRLPRTHNAEDAANLIKLADKLNSEDSNKIEVDHRVVEQLAYTAQGELSPMAALIGGIVSQEVLKAASAKFHPLVQWFYFDAVETLPEEALPEEEFAPQVNSTFCRLNFADTESFVLLM